MDFRQYQYVLKVAELKSMTRAANELFITQPSLSHYIAKIEEELGARLFNRSTTPISLTPAGEAYVETAGMILSLNDKLKKNVRDIVQEKKGLITIGISHARASFFLPYVLPEFKEAYPGIEVRTVETKSTVIEEQVLKGSCDFGVIPLPVSDGRLEAEVVCREELVLVAGEPLDGAKQEGARYYMELSGLKSRYFVLLKKGHGIRTAIDVLFVEAGIHPPYIFETTSNETAYRLATTGMGLTIVPESTIFLSTPMQKPYLYSLSKEPVCWEIAAVYRDGAGLTRAQKYLIEILKKRFLHVQKDMPAMLN